jgi:hypothetical protein
VAGKGSEETTMIKSIFSVCENNLFAYSELGHLANLQPYIEPAAAMTFARNLFVHLTSPPDVPPAPLDLSLNAYTAADLAHSCSLMADPAAAAVYNFTNATTPARTTPVMLEFDHNLYWQAGGHAAPGPPPGGLPQWEAHSLAADPLLAGAATPPWQRSAADLALLPASPAYALPGFRRIAVEAIGLGGSFAFDLAGWARRGGGAALEKIQAETYDRQVGLWREGSYGISPGAGGWAFAPGAWALYRRVDVAGARALRLRLAPLAPNLTVALALGTPEGLLATFDAEAAGAPRGVMGVYEVPLLGQALSVVGGELFLLPSGQCIIDWFQLVA